MPAASARHQPHDVGGQDLAALTPGAQTGRLDDRVAEVVVVLVGDLTAAQPDPQAHRSSRARLSRSTPCCIATAHDNAADAAREHHHEPVTEVLHLGAARFRDRLTQDREVLATDFVRRVRAKLDDSAVEPTRSVNNTATFSVAIDPCPPGGCHRTGRNHHTARC